MDIELPLDFKEFLKLLNENSVKYLLIGDMQLDTTAIPVQQMTWMSGLQSILRMPNALSIR
jgi:hypothetical protein